MDSWSFDAMLPKGDINKMEADPYAEIRAQRARAEKSEADTASLAAKSYDLASWAACINWRGGGNQKEWLDDLRQHIESVQAICKPYIACTGDNEHA
ncbi:hypothetical protein G6M86_07220 [Agrobacterium tumefaciens]|uniref:Uncharacterized protein n=2 Tax=Agrobacterium tumefaciens TaxID=358 RepID=A0AAJ4N101_AGRTU|nr:hypothetical protein G6M86_07220 [Agrobacterium tumefaciens]